MPQMGQVQRLPHLVERHKEEGAVCGPLRGCAVSRVDYCCGVRALRLVTTLARKHQASARHPLSGEQETESQQSEPTKGAARGRGFDHA
jgi:hypothetical protein